MKYLIIGTVGDFEDVLMISEDKTEINDELQKFNRVNEDTKLFDDLFIRTIEDDKHESN